MYSLLIVDDEAIEREAIQYFIAQSGLSFKTIAEAANGIDAVKIAAALMPEIILMDIKMPGKNGLEAAAAIREFNQDCKIIFLTAFNEFDYAHKAIKVKAEDYIIKPAYSETLLATLEQVIIELDKKNPKVKKTQPNLEQKEPVCKPSVVLMERVCQYIDANYNQNIKLDELCNMIGFSKFYLSRIFKQVKHMNVVDYITLRRIEKTKELLLNPQLSIKEISALVGYNEPNYLTLVFKKWEGISPTEYRNKMCRLD